MDGRLVLTGGDAATLAGLPEMNASERTGAELDVLGMDASRHADSADPAAGT